MNLPLNSGTFIPIEGVHPRVHSKKLDKKLGFKISKIERKLSQIYRPYNLIEDPTNKKKHYKGGQAWIGLHPQALQTTYNDIFAAFDYLSKEDISRVVDIGAGYGRVGLVLSSFFPNAQFLGIELVAQRVHEGNRIFKKFNLTNCEIINQNVVEEVQKIPDADMYFIYDFSVKSDIDIVLETVLEKRSDIFYLVAHGDRVENLMSKKYRDYWHHCEKVYNTNLRIYKFNR
ncbi:MAG: hypothetical protein CME65_08185 [Halobacteriovoraceae bacterium]|nr:hypothetical protein [Halobacteriovoraceae bacterium]|tara:strand:+ start:4635 stop:5324 length:690 start_codon:yes stop_codon:yes gene_type:complete